MACNHNFKKISKEFKLKDEWFININWKGVKNKNSLAVYWSVISNVNNTKSIVFRMINSIELLTLKEIMV